MRRLTTKRKPPMSETTWPARQEWRIAPRDNNRTMPHNGYIRASQRKTCERSKRHFLPDGAVRACSCRSTAVASSRISPPTFPPSNFSIDWASVAKSASGFFSAN
jgi:hypothetical protein